MVKMKKILLLILIPILFLTTKSIYAINDDRPIDEVIVAEVNAYYEGWVSISPVPATVINQLNYDADVKRVLYTVSFDRDVTVNIGWEDNGFIRDNVRFLAIVFDFYTLDHYNFNAYVTLYDINNDIIIDTSPIELGVVWTFDFNLTYDVNQLTYNDGYDYGYWEAKEAYAYYVNNEYYTGYYSYNLGYNKGINEQDATGFVGLLAGVFGGLGSLLAIEILPNISLGAIIAVPLVFGVIAFILGKRKGD